MKKRVITGIVAGILFIGVLFLMKTIVFPIVISILSVIAVYEIEKTTGLNNFPVRALTVAVAAVIPFAVHYKLQLDISWYITGGVFYVLALLVCMLVLYENTRFEQVIIALFSSLCVPAAFSVMLLLRDIGQTYPGFTATDGVFWLLLGLFSSWITDIFAFFTGSKLGKHKLCPKISPKKTVEGAIGGIAGALLFNLALLFVFDRFFFGAQESIIKYWQVALLSVVLSVASMCGDLCASTIKRNYGVKDFGNLLPGHGGIMDRFDSCLFVLPALYALVIQTV